MRGLGLASFLGVRADSACAAETPQGLVQQHATGFDLVLDLFT